MEILGFIAFVAFAAIVVGTLFVLGWILKGLLKLALLPLWIVLAVLRVVLAVFGLVLLVVFFPVALVLGLLLLPLLLLGGTVWLVAT